MHFYQFSEYAKKCIQSSIREEVMFNPISIHFLTAYLNKIDWTDRIYRLDNAYAFRFRVTNLISSTISTSFYQFATQCIKFVALRTYHLLINQNNKEEVEEWNRETCATGQMIKKYYCGIISQIKKDKKVYIMDFIIFTIALLSREVMGALFETTRKKEKIGTSGAEKRNSSINGGMAVDNYEEISEKDRLLIEQYTFIIVVYETTGNIVSPHCFQVLRSKLTERETMKSWGKINSEFIIQSFKCIREHYERKKTNLSKAESCGTAHGDESIESALRIFDNYDHYEPKVQIKSKDKVSNCLNSLLQAGHNKQNIEQKDYTRLVKINQISLSKAVKYNYNIAQKDLTLLQRIKKKSESLNIKKHRQKYWRQIKTTNKSIIHIKNKANEEQEENAKTEKKNWLEILANLKKNLKRSETELQKFNPISSHCQTKQKTNRSNSLNLPQLPSKHKLPSMSVNLASRASLASKQSKYRKSMSQKIEQKPRIVLEYKIHEYPQPNQNMGDDGIQQKFKLKKKVMDVKKNRKAFEEKCMERKEIIQICTKL